MDKSWMCDAKFSKSYVAGVKSFMQFVRTHMGPACDVRCPCKNCLNLSDSTEKNDDEEEDGVSEMLFDLGEQYTHANNDNMPIDGNNVGGLPAYLEALMTDTQTELYPVCKKISKTSFIIQLLHLKVYNKLSNRAVDMMLSLMKSAFPDGETLPSTCYGAKKYLQMVWHKQKRIDDDYMRHPADSTAWKDFDSEFPQFSNDPRNVRLALAADGFNPFGNLSTTYSMWPIILAPLNLPPWDCMKQSFLMLSLLIPGKKSPGKDIDVYLQPLVNELTELWVEGSVTFDVSCKQNFRMHAAVLWTINDFPAYGDLSGWVTKGYLACPVCNEQTFSQGLRNKLCFMGHRRNLSKDHPWRRSKKFNGKKEDGEPPRELSGDDVLLQLERLPERTPGKYCNKKRKGMAEELNWSKRSIFFDLPYWSKLKLRHNLDVMHIEKNICESVLGTLMNIERKTKDTVKARLDLEDMKVRKELHLIKRRNGKYVMPDASYVLNKKEREDFCKFLMSVKFLDGYASNISRCVGINDQKISGLKSHDCHILLQRILPVGIRGSLERIWMYPIERSLCELKQSVRNKAHPEGLVAEAYIARECLTFCSIYLQGIETRFNRDERNSDIGTDDSIWIFSKKMSSSGGSRICSIIRG
ncbi:hypothetical protein OROHE_022646 [Orobanche hederae]